jgi:hypothetical protein
VGIVIFWFLCAIFSAALASSKNRSGFGWFLLGLLFGPFGLLVAFFPKVEAPALNASVVAGAEETKTCPLCAETIKRAAKVCRFCNRELGESVPAEAAPKPAATHDQLMAQFGINHDGVMYEYDQYRYQRLEDAVAYARKRQGV